MTRWRRPGTDPSGGQLQSRVAQATLDARRLLGLPEEDRPADLDGVARLMTALETALATAEEETGLRDAIESHARELERLRQRYDARFGALKRVEQAVARLRQSTSPSGVLARAARDLCDSSRLDRVVLSLLTEGFIVPQAAHFRDDAVGAGRALEALRASPARLEHPLIEAELIRRRRATLVTDAQVHLRVHQPTAKIMGWRSYVATPLIVGGHAIGVMHADTRDGPPLDVIDGDVLWAFARGVAEIYETTSLRRSLRRQRDDMRQFVDWLTAGSSELSDAPMGLVAERTTPGDPPGQLAVISTDAKLDDRLVFEDVLTRREIDVLRLLSRGETNREIAAQLVISEATVKFHVINVLRKLHVSNRAEATSRYHRLVQLRSDDN